MVNNTLNQFSVVPGDNTHIDDVPIGAGMTIDQINDAFQHLCSVLAGSVGPVNSISSDIASATTTNLASATGQVVNITGTNTITAFGTVTSGLVYWLRFSAALTVTHNASSLISPTGASISIAANDVLVVQSLGSGNWRILQWAPAGGGMPAGSGADYWGGTVPAGWVLCNGQAISRTGYSNLFAAIGTAYGTGDGSTTFNVPDVRGRVVAGRDSMGASAASRLTTATMSASDTLGATGGAQDKTIFAANLPAHTHTFSGNTGSVSADHTHYIAGYTGTESADHVHGIGDGAGAHVSASGSGAYGIGTSTQVVSSGRTVAHSHYNSFSSGTMSAYHVHAYSGTTSSVGSGTALITIPPTILANKIIKA